MQVQTIRQYNDTVLGTKILVGTIMEVSEERGKVLIAAGVSKAVEETVKKPVVKKIVSTKK